MLRITSLLYAYRNIDLVGFATLTVVKTDYASYAAAYVCHALLMDHIVIPMIFVRPHVDVLNFAEAQRLKWALVKQVIYNR